MLWCLTGLLPARAATQDTCQDTSVSLTRHTDSIRGLGHCIWYLEDPSLELEIGDILGGNAPSFERHEGGVLNFGYTRSAYWTRFDINTRELDSASEWILELALPLIDRVNLYLVQNNEVVQKKQILYGAPWSSRDLQVPNPAFRIALEPDTSARVYLEVSSTHSLRLPISLWAPDAYLQKVSVEEVVRGILLGSILAILAYNIFVAVSVRQASHLWYVLYLVFAAWFISTEQVHGIQLLGDEPGLLHKKYLPYQILGAWFAGLFMARSLLETRIRAPDLDKMVRVCLYAVVTTFVLTLFLPTRVSMEWVTIGSVVLGFVLILLSYLAWYHYNRAARSYFFAWTFAVLGFGIYALTVIGYLPLNLFTSYAPQFGLSAQIILLSFALADQIKQVQGEALEWSERALANLRSYQSLFDNAIEGVFQMSLNRRFLTANPAMAELMGYSGSRELIRRSPDVLETCFAEARVRRRVVEQLETRGTVKGIEARYYDLQGRERWATISLHTVYDNDGNPLHLEGTCIDATERHQRQQIEKEREHERLEKELARNSAEAKSQFLANMSHEIRTPLAAIIGYGENLLEADLNEDQKRASAETVVRSGRHLLELVNDILDHSKIDANKLDVDVVSVNLPEMLDEIRAFFAPRAREKGLDFAIQCDYPLPESIHTDPTRFRQIIINLCGNALKFTEKGSISLMIRCDQAAERLYARVVDTGIGMKPEQVQRLFDPFAQGSAAIARQYGGTGLGLSISRRLAELLGGTIRVRSDYGEGSEFEVYISTGALDDVRFLRDSSELAESRRKLPMVSAPVLKGRILCAEDNEVNRRLIGMLVARTGAELVHVSNGRAALDQALEDDFDLILMDIQMPVMNGRDATRALREAGKNTPVIALTANVMAEDIEDYREAGCNEHLAKPIDKRLFYEVLSRYLQPAEGAAAEPAPRYRGHVLVAEDSPDNRTLVSRMLQRLGLDVTEVASGDEAVRAALSSGFDLVLMDRHMPGMDGVAATTMLRQAGFSRPIVAFTAGDQQEVDELVNGGCDGVLTKPIDQAHLIALLDRILHRADWEPDEPQQEPDSMPELRERFLASLAERHPRMSAALKQQDATILKRETHDIKGSAGAMGYPDLTARAAAVNRLLRQPAPDWEEIARAWQALDARIKELVNTVPEPGKHDRNKDYGR
jgi:PAS domain S-box-containing protein